MILTLNKKIQKKIVNIIEAKCKSILFSFIFMLCLSNGKDKEDKKNKKYRNFFIFLKDLSKIDDDKEFDECVKNNKFFYFLIKTIYNLVVTTILCLILFYIILVTI